MRRKCHGSGHLSRLPQRAGYPQSLQRTEGGFTSLQSPSRIVHAISFSYFFSLVGSSVQIHSTTTGQVVSSLSAPSTNGTTKSQSNVFSCAVVNPHNPFQLITGSLDGCLMIWDSLDGSLLRTIDVNQPIHLICAHEQFKDYVFVAVSRPSTNAKQGMSFYVTWLSELIIQFSRSKCRRNACFFAKCRCVYQFDVSSIGRSISCGKDPVPYRAGYLTQRCLAGSYCGAQSLRC